MNETQVTSVRENPRQGHLAGVLAILMLLAATLLTSPTIAQTPLTTEERADLDIWHQTLTQPTNTPTIRRRAATQLLAQDWPEAHEVLARALHAFGDAELVRIVTSEIRSLKTPPEALTEAILSALLEAPTELAPALEQAVTAYPPTIITKIVTLCSADIIDVEARCRLIDILSQFAYWEAVDGLVPLLDDAQPAEIQESAGRALGAITGQSFGESGTRWQMWIRQNRQQGREGLLANKLKHLGADLETTQQQFVTSQKEREALLNALVSAYEQWYASLNDAAARDALILDLMQKNRPDLNRLALSLIEQRKANAESVSPQLIEAVHPAMDHANASVRQAATRVLGLLDAQAGAQAAATRFATETNEAVVREMLGLLTVHPVAEGVGALLTRLESETQAKSAMAPLLAAARVGLCDDAALQRIAETIMARDSLVARPDAINLLAWTKDEAALNRVITLLTDTSAEMTLRLAAARGLGASGRRDATLIELTADPVVFEAAVRALVRLKNVEALTRLLTSPVPQEEMRIPAVERMLGVITPTQWLEADNELAASGAFPVAKRIGWLSGIFDRPNGNGEDVDGLVRRAICLRLAELHLTQKDPASAIAALQSAPAADTDTRLHATLLATAQIAVGQLSDVAADTTTWFAGLDLLLSLESQTAEQLTATIARIRELFPEGLTEAQLARLTEVEAILETERTAETPVEIEDGGGG